MDAEEADDPDQLQSFGESQTLESKSEPSFSEPTQTTGNFDLDQTQESNPEQSETTTADPESQEPELQIDELSLTYPDPYFYVEGVKHSS